MAYRATKHDLNRTSNSMALPAELAGEIWAGVAKESAIMQLARPIQLAGRGESIPVVTADSTAAWTVESAEKQVSNPTVGLKTMTPYKLACIELFSEELLRDIPALYDELVRRAPAAIAKTFDATVFNGTAPGTGFDVLTSSTAVYIGANTYAQLVAAMTAIGTAGGTMDGIALAAQGKGLVYGAMGSNAPIFVDPATGNIAGILGAKVVDAQQAYKAGTPNVVGFAGDWSAARYGIVDGINVSMSREATVNDGTNLVHLWQSNMVALRIEAEVGFVVRDASAFVKLTDATS